MSEQNENILGEKIERARKRAKLTQKALGSLVNLTHSAISQIEKGRNIPHPSTLLALAKSLNDDFGRAELQNYLNNAVEIEIESRVAAGRPSHSFENIEKIYIPSRMLSRSGKTFAVLVQGESMINAGIFHGDIVVLHECPEPFNGQTVLVRIGEGEASEYTLKTWFKDGSKIILKPENDIFDDIVLTKNSAEVTVVGKFAGLIRFGE